MYIKYHLAQLLSLIHNWVSFANSATGEFATNSCAAGQHYWLYLQPLSLLLAWAAKYFCWSTSNLGTATGVPLTQGTATGVPLCVLEHAQPGHLLTSFAQTGQSESGTATGVLYFFTGTRLGTQLGYCAWSIGQRASGRRFTVWQLSKGWGLRIPSFPNLPILLNAFCLCVWFHYLLGMTITSIAHRGN